MQPGGLTALSVGQQKVGQTVTFNVPPGTGAISIISQGLDTSAITVSGATQPPDTITFGGTVLPNTVVPTILKDPTGRVVYDDDPPQALPTDPSGLDAFYGGSSPWTGMMTVPNATPLLAHTALQGGLVPGQWQFTVNDYALECTHPQHTSDCGATGSTTSAYDVEVVLKPGVAPATGTIDVAFYVVSGTAASLIANPNFIRVTQRLAQLYAQAGLCIATIQVYDLPSWAQTRFGGLINASDDTPCGELSQLFTLSAPGNQINFFLVNGFTDKSGGSLNVIGIDGTIPGPSSYGGTINSGAAVSAADLNATGNCGSTFSPAACGPDLVAYTASHEGGHFLGLYHPTERTGDAFDPLSDTKKCPCISCAQPNSARNNCASVNPLVQPTLMSNSFCVSASTAPECGGGTNLMFWLVGPESTGTLTPQQGQVMRANPVVR
ncbi:MAG TPA: hypothetical protein VG496_17190 [Myxococcales bacterium]|nr:hypothetical protein [Myxococcales bacterium]